MAAPIATTATTLVTPTIGGEPWTPDEIARLGTDLDASLAGEPSLRGAHVGVLAVDTASGTVLYDRRSDEAFQPASTLKLVVGSAALDRLGPDFARTTSAYLTQASGDRLEIDVAGDPFFSLADVDALVAAVRTRRATLVDIVVIVPPDEAPHPAGWTFDDFAQDYAPAISAATLEENVVHVRVRPGDAIGRPATLDVMPSLPFVAKDQPGCSAGGAFLIDSATTAERGATTTVDADALPAGCRRVVGSLGLTSPPTSLDVAVPDPASYLGQTIVGALGDAGVAVGGSMRVDARSTYAMSLEQKRIRKLVWQHTGLPLRAVMPRFWIPSDNFVGEELLMALAPGTTLSRDASLAVERDWLRSIGIDPATTTLADGSGLSQYDRITPRDLVTILQHDWNGPNRQIVLDALPVGGARGTIEGIAGTSAAGRVFAKTGSMMHVRGLAGYLATTHHGAVTFAFEVDDWLGDYASLAAVRAAVLSRIVDDRGDRAPTP